MEPGEPNSNGGATNVDTGDDRTCCKVLGATRNEIASGLPMQPVSEAANASAINSSVAIPSTYAAAPPSPHDGSASRRYAMPSREDTVGGAYAASTTSAYSTMSPGAPQADVSGGAAGGSSIMPPVTLVGDTRESFLYGLCVCCTDCDSCLEAYFCTRCQMSRQCNMMKDGKPEIDWVTCVASCIIDNICTCGLLACCFVCQARRMARERYGIAGGSCGDCCVSYWCSQCATQQILLEMTARGDFPGACCYQPADHPTVMTMR